MPKRSFGDEDRSWFGTVHTEDLFAGGVPNRLLDWLRLHVSHPMTIEWDWEEFRDRFNGARPEEAIAREHGLRTSQVYAVSHQVVSTFLRVRRPRQ
jgi:hypothetical protein